jgi:hypothetical protein
MKMKLSDVLSASCLLTCAGIISTSASAAEPATLVTPATTPAPAASSDTRYGLFDWLDHRSTYGDELYPEPFLVDDSNLEVNELRLNWLRLDRKQERDDLLTAEIEKGFGNLTLEIEIHYERDNLNGGGLTQGFDNIDLGARYPFYEFVSAGGKFDTTIGGAVEVGVPTWSPVSKNAEFVPEVFDDLRVGDHFTLQSLFGYSSLYGNGDQGGLETFEYGFTFGYAIDHQQLPIPGLLQLVPVFELSGATELNKENPGHDELLGDAGFRFNLKTIGRVSPRLGLVWVFPVDSGASEDVRSGIYTSLVFEY